MPAASTTIVLNRRRVGARPGQTVLDAALAAGIVIPHDCATGQCNTCRVRLYDGAVDDRGTALGRTVLACRATVTGEAVLEFDELPPEVTRRGTVASLVELTPDIVEVTVALETRFEHLPGQYVRLAFKGFPARDYSPTLRQDGSGDLDELVFQVRREPNGAVSTELGRAIRAGSPVKVTGPFGTSYHRLGPGRLVLVSSGVGWAPIWSIARASRLREPERPLVVVAGARHARNLYMRPACDWLRDRGALVTLTCSGGNAPGDVVPGRPTLHLPMLRPDDTVVAAGAPGMVGAVEILAAAGGATCYADPFLPARLPARLRDRVLGPLLRRVRGDPEPSTKPINVR